MKKFWIYGVMGCVLAAALSGCGDGGFSSEGGSGQASGLTGESILPETEVDILNYELKYSAGEFTQEDYLFLAGLYGEKCMVRRQRDLLEQCYRLYGDAQAFEILQTLAVNLAEEDALIREEAELLLQNLELEEYMGEGFHMVGSREWFDLMMPKLGQGVRNYFLLSQGQKALTIQVGYDGEGNPFSQVWRHGGDQSLTLRVSGNRALLLLTEASQGVADGAFTLWTIDGASGEIRQEQGTLSEGLYIGEYQARVHVGGGAGDLYDLWSNRENMEYTSYKGAFDEAGRTALEQPGAGDLTALAAEGGYASCLVYAYDEAKTSCLYAGLTEAGEEYSFGIWEAGLSVEPEILVYEPVSQEQAEDGEAPRVRIFDGELQYFSGECWVSLGSVAQYQREDPFLAYGSGKEQADTGKWNGNGGNGGNNLGIGSLTPGGANGGGSADPSGTSEGNTKPGGTTAPGGTSKPGTSNPGSTVKPGTTNPGGTVKPGTTTPPPTNSKPSAPPPEDDENQDNGDDGNNNNNDNSNGGGNGGGDNSGGDNNNGNDNNNPGGGSPGGNDTDVEWTPDIM